MSDIVRGKGPLAIRELRKKKGVSVHVTLFNAEHPAGLELVCAVTVVHYSEFQRQLHASMLVTVIHSADVIGLAPLPGDVFQTVVAALTAAVVAAVRAKHAFAFGSHCATSESRERARQ